MATSTKKTRKRNFISEIVKDPANPPRTILLRGYLGDSSEEGHTRLYFDAQLNNYVEVPADDILHEEEIPREQSPLGESFIWINQDARVIHGPAGSLRHQANFFEGPIVAAAAGLGCGPIGAVSAAPACFTGIQCFPTPGCRPPFTPVHVCPITQVICPITEDGCPPQTSFGCPPPPTPLRGCPPPFNTVVCLNNVPTTTCPLLTPACPPTNPIFCPPVSALQGCLTPACPPTNPIFCPPTTVNACQPTQGCPVLTPACPPTNPIFCPPTTVNACQPTQGCPVFTPACPSVHVINCPTVPIVCQPTPFHGCPSVQACPSLIGCPSGPICGQGFNP